MTIISAGPIDGGAPRAPLIIGVGGTLRPGSSTEKALRIVLAAAHARGARTVLISGPELDLPMLAPENATRVPAAVRLVEALRQADGIILGSPGYHGSISGLIKNVLDYAEDLRNDPRPYFSGRAVGCVATGGGWAGAVHTLGALRDIVHALRGWPTPLGVAINTSEATFDADGLCSSPRITAALSAVADEVFSFIKMREVV